MIITLINYYRYLVDQNPSSVSSRTLRYTYGQHFISYWCNPIIYFVSIKQYRNFTIRYFYYLTRCRRYQPAVKCPPPPSQPGITWKAFGRKVPKHEVYSAKGLNGSNTEVDGCKKIIRNNDDR